MGMDISCLFARFTHILFGGHFIHRLLVVIARKYHQICCRLLFSVVIFTLTSDLALAFISSLLGVPFTILEKVIWCGAAILTIVRVKRSIWWLYTYSYRLFKQHHVMVWLLLECVYKLWTYIMIVTQQKKYGVCTCKMKWGNYWIQCLREHYGLAVWIECVEFHSTKVQVLQVIYFNFFSTLFAFNFYFL